MATLTIDTDFFTDSDKLKPLPAASFQKLIEQESIQQGHKRQQKLLNALTRVGITAVYVVPSILAILYACVLAHKAWIGQWEALEDTLKSMLIPVTTYLAGLLSKNVLPKNS